MKELNTTFDNNTSKEWLKSLLRVGIVTINFTKKDGTNRRMKCTLAHGIIPHAEHTDEMKDITSGKDLMEEIDLPGRKKKIPSINALAVYDTESNAWRSFRWDSVHSIELNFDKEV
jgi:hypothetical protein